MEAPTHDMANLFAQLGLPSDPTGIDAFIAVHAPLPLTLRLHEAPCWTAAQAAFLQEGVQADSDWAEVIDALDEALRAQNH